MDENPKREIQKESENSTLGGQGHQGARLQERQQEEQRLVEKPEMNAPEIPNSIAIDPILNHETSLEASGLTGSRTDPLKDVAQSSPVSNQQSNEQSPDAKPVSAMDAFPDINIEPNERQRLRQAMYTLLEIKNFKLFVVAGLTVMFVLLGQFAIGHHDLQSPFSRVKKSDTTEGYFEQATHAYFKSDYGNASDAWQQGIDKAIAEKTEPVKLAKLYETVADKVADLPSADGSPFNGPTFVNIQQRGIAQLYYSKAVDIYQKNNMPERELALRYKLAKLTETVEDADKETNLRAIVVLDETKRAITSERLGGIYSQLADLLEEKGDIKEAEKYLQKSICYRSDNPQVASKDIDKLTRLLKAEHHYKDLIRVLDYAIRASIRQPYNNSEYVLYMDDLAAAYKHEGNLIGAANVQKEAQNARRNMSAPNPLWAPTAFELKGN